MEQIYRVVTHYPYEGESLHFVSLSAKTALNFLEAYAKRYNLKEKPYNEDVLGILGSMYTDGYNDTYVEITLLDTQYDLGGWVTENPIKF